MAETEQSPSDWRATLPDDLKEAPSLKDYKDLPSLAKSHVELQKMLGNSIRPPGPDAAPEARAEFLAKVQKQIPELVNVKDENALLSAMGKPADAKDYIPSKDVELPESLVAQVREMAKTMGLTKKQAEEAFKAQQNQYLQQKQMVEKAQTALKSEWGAALEERTKLAAVAAEKMGFPSNALEIIKSGRGSAEEVKAFYNMAKALGLDKQSNDISQQQGTGGGPTTLTPLEAMTQASEIRARKEFWDPSINPALTKQLRDKVLKLSEFIERP